MSTAQRVSCGFAMLVILSALTGCSDADADIDEDFSIITGLSGGPTSLPGAWNVFPHTSQRASNARPTSGRRQRTEVV
jgi:hypothetical protein